MRRVHNFLKWNAVLEIPDMKSLGAAGSVPMRRRFELNCNGLFVFFHIVPLTIRVPALRDHLNEYLSLRKLRNFHRTILIRLEIHFHLLFVTQKTARRVESHVDAGVADGLIFSVVTMILSFVVADSEDFCSGLSDELD